jgi:sigma-B regulation protein RsbU (phosphoserine phosphatase)
MKAGIMVSIIKSLFLTHARHLDIPSFFKQCSETIKKMHLQNLYMAMMLLKITNNRLISSSAGIPPIMIYRKDRNIIEELVTKGMPLGAFETFKYNTVETDLFPGDIILLMTDGLSELFNEEREEFGFERIRDSFLHNVHLPASEIVDRLFEAGAEWKGAAIQNDDITLIAIRIK